MLLPPSKTREAQLIEKNFKQAFIAMSFTQRKLEQNLYVYSKIPHPIFNCVIQTEIEESQVIDTIQKISADYQKNHTPHAWWINDRSVPNLAFLEKCLKKMNFQNGPIYKGMHIHLQKMDLSIAEIPNLEIRKIERIELLDQWIEPLKIGFEFSNEVAKAFLDLFKGLFLQDKRLIHYGAFYREQLVGSGSLFIEDGIVGLYNGAVLPPYKKQSIATYLGSRMLLDVKEEGYEDAIVQVADGSSYRIAKKAGFKEFLSFKAFINTLA